MPVTSTKMPLNVFVTFVDGGVSEPELSGGINAIIKTKKIIFVLYALKKKLFIFFLNYPLRIMFYYSL
jgi:hypothetical protein